MFERVEILSLYSGKSLLSWLLLIIMSVPEQRCPNRDKNYHKICWNFYFYQKWCLLTLKWPQTMTQKDHFDTTTDDVKMTCKKCYRKLYPFNPKIGLYHVIKWYHVTKITCFTCLIFFPTGLPLIKWLHRCHGIRYLIATFYFTSEIVEKV